MRLIVVWIIGGGMRALRLQLRPRWKRNGGFTPFFVEMMGIQHQLLRTIYWEFYLQTRSFQGWWMSSRRARRRWAVERADCQALRLRSTRSKRSRGLCLQESICGFFWYPHRPGEISLNVPLQKDESVFREIWIVVLVDVGRYITRADLGLCKPRLLLSHLHKCATFHSSRVLRLHCALSEFGSDHNGPAAVSTISAEVSQERGCREEGSLRRFQYNKGKKLTSWLTWVSYCPYSVAVIWPRLVVIYKRPSSSNRLGNWAWDEGTIQVGYFRRKEMQLDVNSGVERHTASTVDGPDMPRIGGDACAEHQSCNGRVRWWWQLR